MNYYLSLGSNLSDRKENLARCLMALTGAGVRILKCSSTYETEPVGDLDQPWFLNQVVEVVSELEPIELLREVKQIEQNMGRDMSLPNKPRPIDIDILLAEKRIINTNDLKIPHPRLEKRNFILVPLREIAPDAMHPGLGLDIQTLCGKSSDMSQVRLYT